MLFSTFCHEKCSFFLIIKKKIQKTDIKIATLNQFSADKTVSFTFPICTKVLLQIFENIHAIHYKPLNDILHQN
jgi:hypothetical protein